MNASSFAPAALSAPALGNRDAALQALEALGIFTVTDLARYAHAHDICPSELLKGFTL